MCSFVGVAWLSVSRSVMWISGPHSTVHWRSILRLLRNGLRLQRWLLASTMTSIRWERQVCCSEWSTYMPVSKISKLLLLGDGGGGHWLLVRMEWRPSGLSVCLPLLIYPCTIKSRSSLLAPAHPGGPGKRAIKWLWWWWCFCITRLDEKSCQVSGNLPVVNMHFTSKQFSVKLQPCAHSKGYFRCLSSS